MYYYITQLRVACGSQFYESQVPRPGEYAELAAVCASLVLSRVPNHLQLSSDTHSSPGFHVHRSSQGCLDCMCLSNAAMCQKQVPVPIPVSGVKADHSYLQAAARNPREAENVDTSASKPKAPTPTVGATATSRPAAASPRPSAVPRSTAGARPPPSIAAGIGGMHSSDTTHFLV